MSIPPHPHLKSTATAHHGPTAEPTRSPAAGSAPKGVAEGVLSTLRPDPPAGDGRTPVAWLHIVAPKGAIPTATSTCACGRDRSAVGHGKVLALIEDHQAHRDRCALRNQTERRTAA
jgi:hypothetical protein